MNLNNGYDIVSKLNYKGVPTPKTNCILSYLMCSIQRIIKNVSVVK